MRADVLTVSPGGGCGRSGGRAPRAPRARRVALAALLALPACFSTPPVEEYYYGLVGPTSPVEKGSGPRVLVSDFSAAAGYDTTRLAYRISDNELRYYAHRQWIAEPPRMLAEVAVRHLRASGRFAEVGRGDRVKDPDLVLEASVDAIEEVDKPKEEWFARLAMTLSARRGDSDRVLFRHAFDITVPCAKRNPEEVARGAGKIFAREMEKIARRMAESFKK